MNKSRRAIFDALGRQEESTLRQIPPQVDVTEWSVEAKIAVLTKQMSAVHTEVHRLKDRDWRGWINRELPQWGIRQLLSSEALGGELQPEIHPTITLRSYQQVVEQWKQKLFNEVDAAITTTRGAIAQSGSLVLWPTREEPRLMSLVPPVHIALVDSKKLYDTFEQMMVEEGWQNKMPTNALLISGPSKTADIQQVLAYGVHGPKRLIVLLLG